MLLLFVNLFEDPPIAIDLLYKKRPIGKFESLPRQNLLSLSKVLDFYAPFTIMPLHRIEISDISCELLSALCKIDLLELLPLF